MKYIQIIFCTIIVAFLGIVGVCTLDNKIPSNEDELRTFTMFPELDYKRFRDVEYLNQISDAFTDQLEWRWNFVEGYFTFTKDILKQSTLGDIVVGKDQVLFNKPLEIRDWKKYKKDVRKGAKLINEANAEAKKYGAKLIVLDAPRRDVDMEKYIPSYYPNYEEEFEECRKIKREELDPDIPVIDVKEVFEEHNPEGDNRYWYYNDHHINCRGAELVLEEIMKIVNEDHPEVKQKKLDEYKIVKQQVYGALNRKIGLSAKAPDEELNLIPDGWEVPYERWDDGEKSDRPILATGEENNTYSYAYMGDNYGETIVKTNRKELPSIYYCGSSFTNVLEAMSVPSFNNMYSTDLRFNDTEYTMVDYIKKFRPDYVVFISGQSTATYNYKHVKQHLGLLKDSMDLD